MSRKELDAILETIRRLPPADRIAFADQVDRLAWRDRVQLVLNSVAQAPAGQDAPTDAEIDALVTDVRAENSLYERYWTHRRPSAP